VAFKEGFVEENSLQPEEPSHAVAKELVDHVREGDHRATDLTLRFPLSHEGLGGIPRDEVEGLPNRIAGRASLPG
jgi:hypothetical protein